MAAGDFTAVAGSTVAEDFTEAAGSAAVGFAVEVVSTAEAHFGAGPGFAEKLSAEVSAAASVVTASGGVSVSAEAAGDGEDGAGVGA